MSIISFNVFTTGLVGQTVNPRRCTMVTTDSLATITTAGYLNNQNKLGNQILPTDIFEVLYSFNEQTQSGTYGIFQVTYSSSTGFTLNIWENPGNVLLPVVSGDFAVFNGTSGQIKDAGYSASNPALTKVSMFSGTSAANALAVFADTAGSLKPASTTATLGFSLNVTGTVTGSTGLVATTGNVTATAGNIVAGNAAGGNNAELQLFPTTAAMGSLRWIAADNAGDFTVDFTNASHAQATVYTVADIGAATGGIPVSTAPIKVKSVAAAAAAGGSAAQSFTDAFCTSSSNVIGNWNTQANAASVLTIVPGNGSFVVTSTADAGVGTFNYVIINS